MRPKIQNEPSSFTHLREPNSHFSSSNIINSNHKNNHDNQNSSPTKENSIIFDLNSPPRDALDYCPLTELDNFEQRLGMKSVSQSPENMVTFCDKNRSVN